MLLLTRTLFIFTIVFYHISPGSSKLRSFSREWFLPPVEKSSTFFLRAPFDTTNSNFTFAICKDKTVKIDEGPAKGATGMEKNCNLFMIKPAYDELHSHITTCEFRAKPYFLKKPINECDLMLSFAKDKVLLVSADSPGNTSDLIKAMNLQVNTVDMNTCKVHYDQYTAESHFVDPRVNIVLNNNTADLIHENNDKCRYEDSCRQTYDLNGKEHGRTLDYPPNDKCKDRLPQGTGVSIAPNKGYFVSGIKQRFSESSVIAVLHVNSSGWQTELAKKELIDPEIASSDANGLYGFCLFSQWLENPTIHCSQFDADLNVKLNYSLEVPERVQWMAVHNLAERGLLLMTGNCVSNVNSYEHNCQSFRIWRIYSTGRFVKVREVKGKNMDPYCNGAPNLDTRIVESDDGQEIHFEFQCLYMRSKPRNVYWLLKYLSLSLPKKEALYNL